MSNSQAAWLILFASYLTSIVDARGDSGSDKSIA